jgi:XTP/dITP diphosphohydrolase
LFHQAGIQRFYSKRLFFSPRKAGDSLFLLDSRFRGNDEISMLAIKKLVIASNNPGKLREFAHMLSPLGIEVLTQSELGISEADEPHVTFVENALAKARHVSRLSGLPALADDSGICVEALDGAPGVYSARYAGDKRGCDTLLAKPADCGSSSKAAEQQFPEPGREEMRRQSDRANNDKLLRDMQGIADRRAHYYCVLVLVRHADDPQPVIAEGEWHGEIAHEERGDGGFGYDPMFWLPELNKMSSELTHDEKHAISHRGRAMKVLLQRLQPQ